MGSRPCRKERLGSTRKDRERKVLFALIEHYLRTGKPVGSQALQEGGLPNMSSATIRNYFASLERGGFLKQHHCSGGRVPQREAFSEYARYCYDQLISEPCGQPLGGELSAEAEACATSQGVMGILQQAAENISQRVGAAVAISSPRFDRDAVVDLRFVFIDVQRALAVILTEFGLVHTAVLCSSLALSPHLLRKADHFARSGLFQEKLELALFEGDELDRVRRLYQEAMANYFVSYSSVSQEDMWRTGFSRILQHSELEDSENVVAALSLFENLAALRGCTREVVRSNQLKFWLGSELQPYLSGEPKVAVVSVPYHAGTRAVGAVTIVGSMNVFYLELFRLLRDASQQLSAVLTKCLVHNRMSYRLPEDRSLLVKEAYQLALNPKGLV